MQNSQQHTQQNEQQTKVMVIGLDGATFDLMGPWIDEGHLPNLAKIYHNGSHGDLTSVTPPESPLAWPSFATGKNPGKHGVFGFYEPHPHQEYSLSPINARSNQAKTIYKMMGEAGKKVITLAVPFTFPPEQIENGIVIPGEFSIPGELSNTFACYPPEMQEEIQSSVTDHRLGVDTSLIYQSRQSFIEDIHTTTDNLVETAHYLLNNKAWDFFMFVFSGVDQVEHYFFEDHVKGGEFQDAILNYCKKVDETIGEILENIDHETTTLFIMSDHGMQPFQQYFCLNLWLHEKGLLVFKKPAQQRLKQQLVKTLNRSGLKKKLLETFSFRRFSQGAVSNALSFEDVDFSKTKAYAYGFGSIRINLRGRDVDGIVEQEEYDALCDKIITELYREPVGESALNGYKRSDVYNGPFVENAPDIVVTSDKFWPNGLAGIGSFSNVYGEKREESHFIRGMHAMNGIFMAQGPHISPKSIDNAHLIDLAPTILYSMGLPIPDDMDGQLLDTIFEPAFVSTHQPQYISANEWESDNRYEWSQQEEELLLTRLQNLGYLA